MKNKFFNHPLTELSATPRGGGKDEYMMVFIKDALLRLQAIKAGRDEIGFHEPFYLISLKHSLQWLLEYYGGEEKVETDYDVYSYYAWAHLQKFDEYLK
jgi:hypothetical protein